MYVIIHLSMYVIMVDQGKRCIEMPMTERRWVHNPNCSCSGVHPAAYVRFTCFVQHFKAMEVVFESVSYMIDTPEQVSFHPGENSMVSHLLFTYISTVLQPGSIPAKCFTLYRP